MELIYANCIEYMREYVSDSSIDLVVSDPPYLINYQSNHRAKTEKFNRINNDTIDNKQLIIDYFTECHRILKDNTSIYIFCDFKTIEFFKVEFEKVFKLKNLLIWKKNLWGLGDLTGAYGHQYEMILYGHKGRDRLRGKRYPDVLEFDKIAGQNLTHPTEKPVDLLKFLIANSSNEGDKVFDGFAGSGSTLVAAKETKRDYLGLENNRDYFVLASRRLINTQEPMI